MCLYISVLTVWKKCKTDCLIQQFYKTSFYMFLCHSMFVLESVHRTVESGATVGRNKKKNQQRHLKISMF